MPVNHEVIPSYKYLSLCGWMRYPYAGIIL